jgi:hypothetical protein
VGRSTAPAAWAARASYGHRRRLARSAAARRASAASSGATWRGPQRPRGHGLRSGPCRGRADRVRPEEKATAPIGADIAGGGVELEVRLRAAPAQWFGAAERIERRDAASGRRQSPSALRARGRDRGGLDAKHAIAGRGFLPRAAQPDVRSVCRAYLCGRWPLPFANVSRADDRSNVGCVPRRYAFDIIPA